MTEPRLNKEERAVLDAMRKALRVPKRKTRGAVVVAMVGLVGSGKTTAGTFLARELGAAVVTTDRIRHLLLKKKQTDGNAYTIATALHAEVLERGGNLIADSDYAVAMLQNDIKKTAKDGGAHLYFVHTTLDRDVLLGRLLSAAYTKNNLFGATPVTWKGKNRGAVVALRKMWRRTPHHYLWKQDNGGQWVKKSMPFAFAELDTTDPKQWKAEAARVARTIIKNS